MSTQQIVAAFISVLSVFATACKEQSTSVTHEKTALMSLCSVMNKVAESAPAITITNWGQLHGRFNFNYYDKLSISRPGSFPLQRHYVFVQSSIAMEPTVKGRVVVIRHQSVKDQDGHVGRGIISLGSNGYVFTWMWEADVQTMLRRAGANLPEPDLRAAQGITDAALRAASDKQSQDITVQREVAKLSLFTFPEQIKDWLANPSERSLSPFAITLLLLIAGLCAAFIRCCYLAWRDRRRSP